MPPAPKRKGAVIYWADEMAVAQDGYWQRDFAPAGQTPVLAAPSKRHGLSMISAISKPGVGALRVHRRSDEHRSLHRFYEKPVADSAQKVFLILDNLKVHHANAVTAWLEEYKTRIEAFYLPPQATSWMYSERHR